MDIWILGIDLKKVTVTVSLFSRGGMVQIDAYTVFSDFADAPSNF